MTQDKSTRRKPEGFEQEERPTLTLDVARYQSYLDGMDMTDAQRHEFLETMWLIIVGFVDLGFSVQPENSCGKEGSKEPASAIRLIDWNPTQPTKQFKKAAANAGKGAPHASSAKTA